MDNCSRHSKQVAGIADMKLLAENIGDLNYQTLETLLDELQIKINHDSIKDHHEGRAQLASYLKEAVFALRTASRSIGKAYKISKPFMEDKTTES